MPEVALAEDACVLYVCVCTCDWRSVPIQPPNRPSVKPSHRIEKKKETNRPLYIQHPTQTLAKRTGDVLAEDPGEEAELGEGGDAVADVHVEEAEDAPVEGRLRGGVRLVDCGGWV